MSIQRVQHFDDCNVLGVGPLKGKWKTTCLKWLVEKFVKGENQRPYILRMSKFPKFCTVFDLDFRFEEKTIISHEQLIDFAQQLRKIVQSQTEKQVRILITRKGEMCYKKDLKKGNCWASGCHMYLLKHRFNKSEATRIREKFEPLLEGMNFLEEVIDDKVFPIGANGIYMIGSAKPDCKLGLSHTPLCIVGETVEKCTDVSPEFVQELYKNEIAAEDCYISKQTATIVKKPKAKKVQTKRYMYPAVQNDLETIEEEWNFNLNYFFDLIKFFETEVSEIENWKKIVYFLKETNIPTNVLGNALNDFYKPTNPKENFNLLGEREIQLNSKVYKIKRFGLNKFLTELGLDFDYEKLFFPNKFHFIHDVYSGCDKTIIWKDLGSFCRKIQTVFSEIQDHSRKPMFHYKYKSTIGLKQQQRLQFRTCHSINEFSDKYVYYYGEPGEVQKTKLSRVVSEMKLNEDFHVYHQILTYPFFGENELNPTILNIWKQPDLYFYKAIRIVDWTKHSIYEHLKVVMCKNDAYKFQYIQTYIAMKVQQPSRRVEKTLNIVNNTTGCGKTSFFHLVTAIIGSDVTFELTDVKQLNEKFNAHLQGKLLVLVDDIDKLTKSQQDILKTVTTQKHIKLEKKGIDSTKEKCFFDTITTSNNPEDFWISKQDRRNEIIEVSDVRKQNQKNKAFWDEFYKGLEDLDVMKAIYNHFANFKIQLDIRNKTCRFDQTCLDKRISDSLPSSIDFIRNLFEEVQFLQWFPAETYVFGRGYLWITPSCLYRVFTDYLTKVGSRLKPPQKSFISKLKTLNLKAERKRCQELFSGQIRFFILSPFTIKEALRPTYGDVEVLQGGFEKYITSEHIERVGVDELLKMFPKPGLLTETSETQNEGRVINI